MGETGDDRRKPQPVRLLVLMGILFFEIAASVTLLRGVSLPLGSFTILWVLAVLIPLTVLLVLIACWRLVRNRFQFSLASFLIATLVLGAGLGSLISFLQKSQRQREAAARFESLGAKVYWQNEGQPGLKESLGRRYFDDVVYVHLSSPTSITDDDFASLEDLPGLRELLLFRTGISDDHMQHLAKLSKLGTLVIWGANVKGSGIKSLQNLPMLHTLHLGSSPLDDGATEALSRFTGLDVLGLTDTQIGDDDIAHLAQLPRLRELYLRGTAITDNGLTHLAGIPRLRVLHLDQTAVTDAGLAHLKDLEGLENLSLSGTAITDVGLVHLESIQGLKNLDLQKTKVTDEGVARLQEKLPNCEIAR